jgi:hypothetical protein
MHTRDFKTVAAFQMPGTLSSLDETYQWLPCTPQSKMSGCMETRQQLGWRIGTPCEQWRVARRERSHHTCIKRERLFDVSFALLPSPVRGQKTCNNIPQVCLLWNPWFAQGLNHLNHERNEETSMLRLKTCISGSSTNNEHKEIMLFDDSLKMGICENNKCHRMSRGIVVRPNFSNPCHRSVWYIMELWPR